MKKYIHIAIFIILSQIIYSQDPQFTQFYSNPLYLAPSFAGAIEGSRIATMCRRQWAGVALPFKTYTISFDHYFSNFNSGVGLLFLKDEAGSGRFGITNVSIQYSYNFQVFDFWKIRPGLSFSYVQSGLDFNRLTFNDQYSEDTDEQTYDFLGSSGEDNIVEKSHDIDVSPSILIYSKKIWFGATVDHLLKPKLSLYNGSTIIPIKYSFYGGYELVRYGRLLKPLDESLVFAFLYKTQGTHQQLDLGLYWYKMPFVLGFWYRGLPFINSRRGDAVSFLTGYKLERFSVGYSYDFTISNLIGSTNGAHEISLVYNFKTKRKKKYVSIPCPHF